MWEFRLVEFHITGNYNGSAIFVPELVSLWSQLVADKGHFSTLRIELSPFLFIDGDICRTSEDAEMWDVGCQSAPHLRCFESVFCYWCHIVNVNRSPDGITPEPWTESGHVAHWLRLVQYGLLEPFGSSILLWRVWHWRLVFDSGFFHEPLLFIGEELTALICSDSFELSICVTLSPRFISFECSKLFTFIF